METTVCAESIAGRRKTKTQYDKIRLIKRSVNKIKGARLERPDVI
jgi:hypothetical protein